MARAPALIFDFGNVLVFFDYQRVGQALGPYLGLTGPEFLDRARGRGLTPLMQRYEAGAMSSAAFEEEVCALMGLELPEGAFAPAWNDIFRINEPVARLAAWLKGRGYRLILGSNTNDLHATHYRRAFAEALAPFDRLVLSHEVGHIKPSARFYLACAEAAGVPPGECVFIDDLEENIAGAKAAGLQGLVFRDYDGLLADLARLGIDVPDPTS